MTLSVLSHLPAGSQQDSPSGSPTSNRLAYKEMSNLFKLLSDPFRLEMLVLMTEERLGVQEIADLLCTTQANLSHHIALLRHANLIDSDRDGKKKIYKISAM